MTMKLKKIRIFGDGMYALSAVITRQRRLNCYLEVRRDEDRSSIVCIGTPGLSLAFNVSAPLNLPLRGLIGNDSALYTVSGNAVQSLTQTGVVIASGSIGTVAGLVGMALNPTQVMIVDGSAGYVFNPTTGAVTVVGGAFPNGALTITYCNGFFVAEQPGTNQFFVSDFNNGASWSGLAFAAAVQAIDGIKAADTLGGLLIIFSGGHLEFWQNAGLVQEPFVYITNSASMYGLAAVNGRVHVGDSLVFLARTNGGSFQNAGGGYQICRIRGYQVKPCSTTDIDNILQTMARTSTIADCTAYSYMKDEHQFAQFNFPTANRSLLFDATNEIWSEVQTGVTPLYAARHQGNLAAGAFGNTYVADWQNGNLYRYDPSVYTDNGNTIVREVVTRTAVEEFNKFRISAIYLDMETGVGVANPGAGYDPVVELSVARDARDFGVSRRISLGRLGQYVTRVLARRWGSARTMALKIRMTDPVPFVITSGAVMTSQRAGRQSAAPQARRRA